MQLKCSLYCGTELSHGLYICNFIINLKNTLGEYS